MSEGGAMKRSLIYLPLVLTVTVSAVHAKKMPGDDLSNMIIQGENRLQVHAVLPPVEWSPAVENEIEAQLGDNKLLLAMVPPALENPPLLLPDQMMSKK